METEEPAKEVAITIHSTARGALALAITLFGVAACAGTGARPALPRIAVFRADVTPPLGEPNAGNTASTEVLDPLWTRGSCSTTGRRGM